MRSLFLLCFAGFALLGCSSPVVCGPANCAGCCDTSGVCQTLSSAQSCGSGGSVCSVCPLTEVCQLGVCVRTLFGTTDSGTPPRDSGVTDAGLPRDGGVTDGGPPRDAGTDGGIPGTDGGFCPSGQRVCNGPCVDTQTNPLHCGLCDRACTSAELCQAGSCQPKGADCRTGPACPTGYTCDGSTGACIPCPPEDGGTCAGKSCGPATNSCGQTVSCGTCTAPQTCGGGGAPFTCGCTPESTSVTCAGKSCDSATNNCGKSVLCGTCLAPQSCGGGGTPYSCGCTSQSPSVTCGARTCGSAIDNCGKSVQCGPACTSCSQCPPVPSNSVSTCDAGMCGFACNLGYHACSGSCPSVESTFACGASCTSCPVPANGTAVCDGVRCGVRCPANDAGVLLARDCDGVVSNGCESTLPCAVPTSGLVAFYPFSGNANDAVGLSHGTVVGATLVADRKGSPGAAYHFVASSSQRITMPANSALPVGAAPRTVSVWLRATPSSSYQSIVNWGSFSTGERFGLTARPTSGELFFTGQYMDVSTYVPVDDGVWHHLAATFNGVTVRVYIDGVERARSNTLTLFTSGSSLMVSQKVGTSAEYVNGDVDDLRIYNRALSASEVEALARE